MTLLDVNVLLALVDPLHAHHERQNIFSSIGTPRLGRLVPLWKTDFSVCFLALAMPIVSMARRPHESFSIK